MLNVAEVRKSDSEVGKTLLDNRCQYVENQLELSSWQKLAGQVSEFEPDYVICTARKMPRLLQLLRSCEVFNFPGVCVSDFAIEFLGDALKGKRIAILDDALNVGSTLANIWKRLPQVDVPPACFVLSMLEGGGRALVEGMDVRCASAPCKDLQEYREAATRASRSLWALNKPLEVEFPIFVAGGLPISFFQELPVRLTSLNGEYRSHELNIAEAQSLGLFRYAVDVDPENHLNEKIRLYADSVAGELVLVPMAASRIEDKRRHIEERFRASLLLGKNFMENVFGDLTFRLDLDEAELLFGSPRAGVICAEYENGEISVSSEKAISENFYMDEWKRFRANLEITDTRFLSDCLEAFFIAAAKYYEADCGIDYDRLCKGPTFAELRRIMAELWQAPDYCKGEFLDFRLSEMLDEYIDKGFIVPVTNSDGWRVFRKGEPYPWRNISLKMLSFIHGDMDPAKGINILARELSPGEQSRYEKMRLVLETPGS